MRPVFQTMLASSFILALSGMAQAEITLSGDARMGIEQSLFSDDVSFTSRARVRFDMSGETDNGLSFGARVLMNEAELAVPGEFRPWVAGRVYISGPFGMLSMGDTDSAAEAAVGSVSAISLTGLGDNHETTFYQSSVGAAWGPSVLYEYYGSGWAVFASATGEIYYNGLSQNERNLSLGGRYVIDGLTVALGVEQVSSDPRPSTLNVVASVTYDIGEFSAKAVYGQKEDWNVRYDFDPPCTPYCTNFSVTPYEHYYFSLDWERGPLAVAVFYARQPDDTNGPNSRYYGIGAAYDLGGGAGLTGGIVRENSPFAGNDQTAYDFGVTMSF
ncbi:porin [Paragemmobacter straminiformis]|uniref:Porin n=1 Tax=Paragemmobacter straminiformis TaxID=2045119 RepID=A0A842I9Z0_9RHOB|nr:porin [Gemmobacter straminiformis]MBC2836429.1 porin [Gemmobacter straminiformis]